MKTKITLYTIIYLIINVFISISTLSIPIRLYYKNLNPFLISLSFIVILIIYFIFQNAYFSFIFKKNITKKYYFISCNIISYIILLICLSPVYFFLKEDFSFSQIIFTIILTVINILILIRFLKKRNIIN